MTHTEMSRLRRGFSALLAAVMLLAAVVCPTASAADHTKTEYYNNAVLYWTNIVRGRNGLGTLQTTDSLNAAAAKRASELVSWYDQTNHTRTKGGAKWTTVLGEYSIEYNRAAENVAHNYNTPAEVVRGWMGSTGHRANILEPKFQCLGVGYSETRTDCYWEQLFLYKNGGVPGARSYFNVAPTGVSVNKQSLEIAVGRTAAVTANPEPVYATSEISCKSSDPTVCSVESVNVTEFTVKGNRNGTATLTFKCGSFSKSIDVTVGTGTPDADAGPYLDVKKTDYFCDAVVWAVENDITNGMSKTLFGSQQTCTRAQAVTFLYRAAGEPKVSGRSNPFKDVSSDQYYYNAVLWAVSEGITNGTDKTHFSPDGIVTREQFVTFLWRLNHKPVTDGKCPFVDVKQGDYFYNAVLWAVSEKVTKGMDAKHFGVSQPCLRCQVVQFLYNVYN